MLKEELNLRQYMTALLRLDNLPTRVREVFNLALAMPVGGYFDRKIVDMEELSTALVANQQQTVARKLLEKAVALDVAKFKESHWYPNLAQLYFDMGNFKAAAINFRAALKVTEEALNTCYTANY